MTDQQPRVLNKRIDLIPPDAVYIGRPSKYGNPFKIGRDGTRIEVIAKYRDFVLRILRKDSHWLDDLKGKDLFCWCKPLPCHGDVLLELANKCRR